MDIIEKIKAITREHVQTPVAERKLRELILETLCSAESEHWSVIEANITLADRILKEFDVRSK